MAGERLLPASWVERSFGRYGRLAPLDVNGHEFGYLWWHHRYPIAGGPEDTGTAEDAGTADDAGEMVESVEARGYGGQYLFVIPELDLVTVVTAGNYRNGRTRQSEDILRDYILPAVRR